MDLYMFSVLTAVWSAVEAAHECTGTSSIYASTEPQLITSPGFPEHYPNSMECSVMINATEDHVLYVEIVHMQLDVWNNTCEDSSMDGDFVVAYDGHNETNPVLHKWCGTDHAPVSTSGESLFLMFSSDEHVSDLGFVLRFWSQKEVNASCEDESHRYLLGNKSIYLTLPGISARSGAVRKCVYHVAADVSSASITLFIHAWNMSVGYSKSKLEIYDGPNTSSPLLLSWGNGDQPFSHLTSSGKNITIVLSVTMKTAFNTFTVKATGNSNSSCGRYNETVEEITSLPSYISLNSNWPACPLKIISRDFSKTLRLDVIGIGQNWSNIGEYINITEGSTDGATILATGIHHCITYRSRGPVVYVKPSSFLDQGKTISLRVLALERIFNGEVTFKQAVNSSVRTDIEMKHLPNNAYIVYNIRADNDDNIVQLEMTGNFFTHKKCERDVIDFFDGNPRDGRHIRRWCPDREASVTVTSTKSYLSFVVKTDEVSSPGYYKGTYFSLGNTSMCDTGLVDLKASAKMTKYVMSPNYPGNYSLNNMCTWRIAAPRINYVVIAEVTWSDLPDDCSDMVYVIYGVYPTDNTVARICGKDTPVFRSTGPILILRFTSNSKSNRGGFKIAYTTEHRTGGQRLMGGPPVGEIAGACIALFVVGGIIYVCVHENRKRRKEYKRKREDY